MDLPEFLAPPPEKEALELALDKLVFGPVEADEAARLEAEDDVTPPLKAYLLLDASIDADIAICAEAFDEPARCLFDGAAFEELADVGPWLIELRRFGDAWDWYVEDGWGKNWGIVIHTRKSLAKLKTHFKKFIKVTDEQGETYFFKFYRPEHLNTYLPIFDADQTAKFMEGIDAILTEAEGDPETLMLHHLPESGELATASQDLIEIGMPLRIQPPSPEEVQAILANIANSE